MVRNLIEKQKTKNKTMKIKQIFLATFILINLNSCGVSNDKDAILNEYENFDSTSKIHDNYQKQITDTVYFDNNLRIFLEYSNEKKLKKIKSFLANHMIGHYFEFNDNGDLKKYIHNGCPTFRR